MFFDYSGEDHAFHFLMQYGIWGRLPLVARIFSPTQEFSKNILHLSGRMLILSLLVCYVLKDVSVIFQPRFIPQGRERKINRLRLKNQLA